MRSHSAGRIGERLWYLGREETGVYLLEGDACSLIISGAMSYLAPVFQNQVSAFGIDEGKIKKMLILHSHFDHVGLVPFFRRRYPDLQVYGSARAWQILTTPRAIETINASSRLVAQRWGLSERQEGFDLEWREEGEGTVISEGARIELGGMTVQVLETPGHSSCSISAYVPEIRALFPSDAGGIPYKEKILPSGNSNFTQYQQSLERLKSLDIDMFCADHYGYVSGRDAEGIMARSIDAARDYRAMVEEIYRRTASIDETVKAMVTNRYTQAPDFVIAPEIYAGVCRQIARHIVGSMSYVTKP
jgi:glyoxylase-like metal-dependent hydrolase (beta-lactamase superfamily II)